MTDSGDGTHRWQSIYQRFGYLENAAPLSRRPSS